LLNAEFNQLIGDTIKNEPAPFIYERLGEKFRYYFIDEMQDTSQLQWQNLIPLIDHAISSENELGEQVTISHISTDKKDEYPVKSVCGDAFTKKGYYDKTLGSYNDLVKLVGGLK
jgi:superfamily I DNA/RNA helicase